MSGIVCMMRACMVAGHDTRCGNILVMGLNASILQPSSGPILQAILSPWFGIGSCRTEQYLIPTGTSFGFVKMDKNLGLGIAGRKSMLPLSPGLGGVSYASTARGGHRHQRCMYLKSSMCRDLTGLDRPSSTTEAFPASSHAE